MRIGVPRDLKGFLTEVHTPRLDYVKPNSAGLWVTSFDFKRQYLGGVDGRTHSRAHCSGRPE